jgi:hypothetical protein
MSSIKYNFLKTNYVHFLGLHQEESQDLNTNMYINVHFWKCHFNEFFYVGRRRRPRNYKRFQHTSNGEQQVWSKNLELNPFFDFKFLS